MPIAPINSDQIATFSAFYGKRITESGGARDDTDELAIARDILQAVVNDGLTPTADGGASYVRRGALDWSDPATLQAAQATTDSGSRKTKSHGGTNTPGGGALRSKELLQGLAILVGVVALIGWYFWPSFVGSGQTAPNQAKTGTPTPEVVSFSQQQPETSAPTPVATLQTELLADIAGAGGVKTGLVTPRTLEIKGVSFIVQPVSIVAGDWPLPEDERAASWVYGTVVNYALGLTATPANRQLLAALKPGDELLLRMSTGPAYRFAFADLVRVAPHASEIFRQNRPGLILTLLGDEEQPTRVVLRAVYVPNTDPDEASLPVARTVNLGETADINEALRLTCLGRTPLALPDTPPGYINVGVDYRLENRLADLPLVTSAFAHHLEAGGITYPAIQTLETRMVGAYGPLPTTLQPGQMVTATALYAVPETALQSGLVWQFAPDPTGGPALRVTLPPYLEALAPQVSLQEASRYADTLAVKFRVQAPALRAVTLTANDLRVQGGRLSPLGHQFPWQVAAGQTGQFTLLLLPDQNVSGVTVVLLEQGFEINWE